MLSVAYVAVLSPLSLTYTGEMRCFDPNPAQTVSELLLLLIFTVDLLLKCTTAYWDIRDELVTSKRKILVHYAKKVRSSRGTRRPSVHACRSSGAQPSHSDQCVHTAAKGTLR